MALDPHASNLISLTAKAFNGDVTNISPMDGLSLINSWTSFFQSTDQANSPVAKSLGGLRIELQNGNLNSEVIQSILNDLVQQAGQTTDSANPEDKPELSVLSEALQSFSQQINGESGPAQTGGQAPMTSTVGGNSATSGVGAASFTPSNDDLADREGGTVDNEPDPYMDDTTGSDGAGSTDGPERSDSNETGDSSYSSESQESRSDTGRVDGMGLSGGTGDSDTAQSGGRSQY